MIYLNKHITDYINLKQYSYLIFKKYRATKIIRINGNKNRML